MALDNTILYRSLWGLDDDRVEQRRHCASCRPLASYPGNKAEKAQHNLQLVF